MRKQKILALSTGLVGLFLALLTLILPVKQTTASVDWPQQKLGNIILPLVSYVPETINASISCKTIVNSPDNTIFASSVPLSQITNADAPLIIRNNPHPDAKAEPNLEIFSQGTRVAALSIRELKAWNCDFIYFASAWNKTSVTITGVPQNISEDNNVNLTDDDLRPQITGIFTNSKISNGINIHLLIDSRYTTTPTLLKWLAIIFGLISTIISLLTLRKLDNLAEPLPKNLAAKSKFKLNKIDVTIIALLLIWYFIGANTSDDGYILTMSRTASHSGYPSNYYRWFAAPESPFGWYYYIFTFLAKFSTASIWMRLPSLICAICCWFLLSRFVIPRLGVLVKNSPQAYWAAGLTLLAFWLPLNNGMRPEPIIALGTLTTWCLFERTIATRRLFPAAIGLMVAGFTIGAGPTGIITIGIILVSIPVLMSIIISRCKAAQNSLSDYLTFLVPLLAASCTIIFVAFQKLTLRTFLTKAKMQTYLGPSNKWFDEPARYASLMGFTEDGPLMRRFPIFLVILALVIIVAIVLRKGIILGCSKKVTIRILAALAGTFFLMIFTPTKWTHHFGVFAGIAAAIMPVFAIALSERVIKTRLYRILISAVCFFVIAFAFTGPNKWWSYSDYGVPWHKSAFKVPFIKPISLGTIIFGISILTALYAGWIFLKKHDSDLHKVEIPSNLTKKIYWNGSWPLSLALCLLLFTEFSSMGWAALVSQRNGYSIAKGNFNALKGKTCGLANYVLVEPDSNKGFLTPENTDFRHSLSVKSRIDHTDEGDKEIFSNGFAPDKIKEFLLPPQLNQNNYTTGYNPNYQDTTLGKENGKVHLPFGLNPNSIPVLGSWQDDETAGAQLTSDWFTLPPAKQGKVDQSTDLISVTAAGKFDPHEVVIEYSTSRDKNNRVPETDNRIKFHDAGFDPMWRNLRISRNELPKNATAIRIIASISETALGHWVALTPPRIPQVTTLEKLVGKQAPVLIDWTSGFAFPCQRPFDHYAGVAVVPQWRIQPNLTLSDSPNSWEDSFGGGPLGWQQLLSTGVSVSSYLLNDLSKDWGDLKKLIPNYTEAVPAEITYGTRIDSGWYNPTPIKHQLKKDEENEDKQD